MHLQKICMQLVCDTYPL
jgi:hypothetical protein